MSSKIFLTLLFVLFLTSCQEKTDIDDQYLNDIARNSMIEVESQNTNNNSVVASTGVPTLKAPDSVPVPKPPVAKKPAPAKKPVAKKPAPKKVAPKKVAAKKPTTFYSPYIEDTVTTDNQIIKDVRLMIANKEYTKAASYIQKYDLENNPPANLDVGHLYHFKGIVYYFLSANDRANVVIASDAFIKVADKTEKEKFKRLASLWNGMLYVTYANNQEDLNKAIALFDEILNKKGRDVDAERFLADAAYYRAVALRKLNRVEEANEEIRRIKTGVYQDKDIYSQKRFDYVPVDVMINEYNTTYMTTI